jgi:hypothetical protein
LTSFADKGLVLQRAAALHQLNWTDVITRDFSNKSETFQVPTEKLDLNKKYYVSFTLKPKPEPEKLQQCAY